MSARISRGSPTETPKTSAHDQKMKSRVDKLMESANKILDTPKSTLDALIKLHDINYELKTPYPSRRPCFVFLAEFYKSKQVFKKDENQAEFRELVIDRLAKDYLGEHYDEYIEKKRNKSSDSDMAAWIDKKLEEIILPTMRTRSLSQPVLLLSTKTAPSSKANTTNPRGMPDGMPTATQQLVWQTPASPPQAPNIPSSARSSQFLYPAPSVAVPSQFSQPQPLQPQPLQPQPLQPNTHMPPNPVSYPGMPATLPQFQYRQFPDPATATAIGSFSQAGQTPVNSAALSVRATFSMLGVVADLAGLGFNRDGYVVLLQYLVAGWLPSQNHTESLRQFNEKFLPTIQCISEKCATLNPAQQRPWTDNVAVYLVGSVYELDLAEALESRLRQGMDRTAIASWLQTAIPR